MNELPELVIWLISDHLNYEDVRNLRLTSKRLKEAIDQRRFDSLHLFVREFQFERNLFQTGELVNYSNTFRIDSLSILRSTKFKSQFSGLTKLTIYFDSSIYLKHSEKMNLNDLNSFVHLLHLEVLGPELEKGKLDLSNLKIARFENRKFRSQDFELHCPQLDVLGLSKGILPKLTPETRRSIRFLYLNFDLRLELEAFYRNYELGLYEQLTNLSIVSFRDSKQAAIFTQDLVDRKVCVPSLKRIQVKDASSYNPQSLESFMLFKSCEETKHIEFQINSKVMDQDGLIELRVQTRRNGRRFILVSSFGIREISFFANNSNFDYLIASDGHLFFNYDGHSPVIGSLINKFNLTELQIGKGLLLNESVFECLLQKGRRIRRLTIESDRLTQQQLDRMPDYLTGLRYLIFDRSSERDEINFDFVAKFNLISLIFGFNITKETMSFILKRFKCEPSFRLEFARPKSQYIFIPTQANENGWFEIIPHSSCQVGRSSGVEHEFVSLEDAIDFYYEKDLFNTKIEYSQFLFSNKN